MIEWLFSRVWVRLGLVLCRLMWLCLLKLFELFDGLFRMVMLGMWVSELVMFLFGILLMFLVEMMLMWVLVLCLMLSDFFCDVWMLVMVIVLSC